ncbi:MAG TPA: CocE/NonD family hydrolase [Vicinamibacterales bacterium]|jgi:putative CocE/NonD family hydrolase|nr:CocE/NonD family hydrolase [Vicinamibacterales bacterium]
MAFRQRTWCVPTIVLIMLAVAGAWGSPPEHRRDSAIEVQYTKHEFRIPMRDGVRLFTAVYVPRDASRPYPFLITRTPFGVAPYGRDAYPAHIGPSDALERAGYIFVLQDARGRFQSEGRFVDVRPHIDQPRAGETDENTDMYDTVEWLLRNVAGNNGRVGVWGMSYAGFYTSASLIDSHPAIKAASPQAPVTDLFRGDDAYHNGAFMLAAQFLLYSSFFRVRPDGPDFPGGFTPFDYGVNDAGRFFLQRGPALKEIAATIRNPIFDDDIAHGTYDEYWKRRDISQHLNNVRCAVLNVAGFFDAEDLAGPFRTYHAIEERNPGVVNVLVAGPWEHGAWNRVQADSPERLQFEAAEYYRSRIVFPFFEYYLKGNGGAPLPEATVFETGTNQWRQYQTWPPPAARRTALYLHAGGRVSLEPPASGEPPYDAYVSDPFHPVPYLPIETTEFVEKYMFGDQSFAATRPDVLTYLSDPLPSDLTVSGPVSPRLQVSSTGTDADFDVKLIDVFPGQRPERSNPLPDDVPTDGPAGYAQLVRGEPMRARFRVSMSTPMPLRPNEVTPVGFDMPDVNHTFRRGHRIMVQIQSSWFPLTDLNPQSFVPLGTATRADFVKATQRVYHSPAAASRVEINVLGTARIR